MMQNDAAIELPATELLKCFHGGFFAVAVTAQRHQVVHVVGSAVFQSHDVVHFVPRRQLTVAVPAFPRLLRRHELLLGFTHAAFGGIVASG